MTSYGWWLILFAVIYTLGLILAGHFSRKKAAKENGYFVGGRKFNKWIVAFCITGLFSGSTFISIVELSYLSGISAIWYGVAETVQILIIAFVIIGPFREKLVVTVSGMIGDRYGRAARGIGGAITAFAFPMWSVATAIAFASAIHVFTGFSLTLSVAFTALLLYLYLQAGGMWSIAFTQTMNFIVFIIMFIIGIIAFFVNPGVDGLRSFAASNPAMFQWDGVGIQVIVAWFGTFLVNVILAQAAFQMSLSCKTPEEGQKGLKLAVLFGIPFIILGALFGISAAIVIPDSSLGLVALPQYLMEVLPAPLVGLFFLGIWACALGWGAPCQFSGATSLGKDVGSAVFPQATSEQLVKYTKRSLLVLSILMIVFGMARTEQSAWWNILAWTMRNSATFAPVVAVLFWRLATKEAVVGSMVGGFLSGLIWYHLGGWLPNEFHLNIHPVWIGMSANIGILVLITLLQNASKLKSNFSFEDSKKGYYALFFGALVLIGLIIEFETIYNSGLLGIFSFSILMSVFIATIIFVPHTRLEDQKDRLRVADVK
ncbi:sodium:solute symporter family protein [Cerasibacillus terrae]|uniref:Sodium:solute symporter family protein n=1 Tax=Cerasibacillus terrae TaxID=2498845 RepID=A0A5C8P1Q9_9BACI|nr:sodium:solute symporter family protein [Cerasibacillus terrae]TXL67451.1 sodium:solute symporter family protein [Cerasibacillus terrae]